MGSPSSVPYLTEENASFLVDGIDNGFAWNTKDDECAQLRKFVLNKLGSHLVFSVNGKGLCGTQRMMNVHSFENLF